MSSSNNKPVFFIIFLSFIIALIIYSVNNSIRLINNGSETNCEIIDKYFIGGKHYIKYSFTVKGKKYFGEQKVYVFDCDDGITCCLGRKFKVVYDIKNPNNSNIDLGKYNKYKSRTDLYDVLK